MRRLLALVQVMLVALLCLTPPAQAAAVRVLVVQDPADEGASLLPITVSSHQLSKLLNGPTTILPSLDLRDALRASRTGEYDVIIAPAHVTASAIAHGYELIAASGGEEKYVLVAVQGVTSVAQLKGRDAYFPREDSLRTYVGRSLIVQGGLPLRSVNVAYQESSVAGLMSLSGGRVAATVALESEWQGWAGRNPNIAHVISTSRGLPAGFGVAVRNDLPQNVRTAVLQWVTTTDGIIFNAKRFRAVASAAPYHYVASLGIVTPEQVSGITRVTAQEALQAAQRGAQLVDVRTEREYAARHARGAILVPYQEKSHKEPQFDGSLDKFAGMAQLNKSRPVVFMCNGPECWKSYKASVTARDAGFKEIYWLRGGVPEWARSGLPTEP